MREIVRSRFDKNYVLSSNSPAVLYKDEDLIIRTLGRNPNFIEELPEDTILKSNELLSYAIQNGYSLRRTSPMKSNPEFVLAYLSSGGKIIDTTVFDYNVLEIPEIKQRILEYVRENPLLLERETPEFLKEDKTVVLNCFRMLFSADDKSVDVINEIQENNLLKENFILDIESLQEFLLLCNTGNVDRNKLLNCILQTPGVRENLRENPMVVNELFNCFCSKNVKSFFEEVGFTEENIDVFLENEFTGSLREFAEIYSVNPAAFEKLNGALLGRNIPMFKIQEYASDENFQKKLLGLPPYKFSLFQRITNNNLEENASWNRTDYYTLENLYDGYYDTLIVDIMNEEKKGNLLTKEELDVLSNLFSAKVVGPKLSRSLGEKENSNNVFNITTKNELEYYHRIRETICDIVINNPELESSGELKKYEKYLKNFRKLDVADRMKLAILQKGFGMNLSDAITIVQNFGDNIEGYTPVTQRDNNVIEKVNEITNILNCNEVSELQMMAAQIPLTLSDFSQTTFLFDEAQKVFERDIKRNLYSPKKEDMLFVYSDVEVYSAPLDFEALTKYSAAKPDKNVWAKSMTRYNGENRFRRKTCVSFTNGELLNPTEDGEITFAFGQTARAFSFAGMYKHDAGSNIGGDQVYGNLDVESSTYMGKEDFVTETKGPYNEIVVDTLAANSFSLDNDKLMPEYMIYYQLKSDMTMDEREGDINWQNTVAAAREFGIPIVCVDCEAVRAAELEKIQEDIASNQNDYKSVKRMVGRIKHYVDRYKDDLTNEAPEISAIVSKSELDEKEAFLKRNKPKSRKIFSKKKEVSNNIQRNDRKFRNAGFEEI